MVNGTFAEGIQNFTEIDTATFMPVVQQLCGNACLTAIKPALGPIARASRTVSELSGGYTGDEMAQMFEAAVDGGITGTFDGIFEISNTVCTKDPTDNTYCAKKVLDAATAMTNLGNATPAQLINGMKDIACSYCGQMYMSMGTEQIAGSNLGPAGGMAAMMDPASFLPLLCSTDSNGDSCLARMASFNSASMFVPIMTSCQDMLFGGSTCSATCRNAIKDAMQQSNMGCCFNRIMSMLLGQFGSAIPGLDLGNNPVQRVLEILDTCGLDNTAQCGSRVTGTMSLRLPNLRFDFVNGNATLKQQVMDALVADLASATKAGPESFTVVGMKSGSLIADVSVRSASDALTDATFAAAVGASQSGALAFPSVRDSILASGASPAQYATDPNVPLAVMFAADQVYAQQNGVVVAPPTSGAVSASLASIGAMLVAAVAFLLF
jgi:hypothetical protein